MVQQQWDLTPTGMLRPVIDADEHVVGGMCLKLPQGNVENGVQVEVGVCDYPTSTWRFNWPVVQFHFAADFCLDAGDMSEGFQLIVWECNGLDQQAWGYDSEAKTLYLANSRRLTQVNISTGAFVMV